MGAIMGFSLSREIKYISSMLRMLRSVKSVDASSDLLIADELEMRVDAYGSNVAFIEGEQQLTYDEMETYANRVAAWAKGQGLGQGDCVAFFARNRLQYIPLWFGLTKLGIIPALLNYQLSGKALAHCVNISDVAHVIMDVEMADQWMMVLPMYHATGGLVGCGAMLTNGGAVVIIPKFSASKFWDDAVKYGATMFTYVGELCRFLLSQPPTDNERKHKISWIIVSTAQLALSGASHLICLGNLTSILFVMMSIRMKIHAVQMGSVFAKI